MNPKLPLDGHIYTLTAGRVLHINVCVWFQINLGKLLFRATLKVRLIGSCLSTALKMDNFVPKSMHISQLVLAWYLAWKKSALVYTVALPVN